MQLVYPFDYSGSPELSEVGGKAMSLILMTQQGLPVPPGFVLTAEFFRPWFDQIKSSPEWLKLLASPEQVKLYSQSLKRMATELILDDERTNALYLAIKSLQRGGYKFFAVRSSSPEEDLEGASFAGGYETTLGVSENKLVQSLRHSFASSLDERVFAYKQQHGFPTCNPRLAIIVQAQIASEVAGVAFSLNPLSNCYDEAVINSNYGLGESVVSGLASPDTFVVDKVSKKVLEQRCGKKEVTVWLSPDGGTTTEETMHSAQLTLSDSDVLSLLELIVKVEAYYNKPMDIEWARSKNQLYLLQARPITAYIPLPETMQTDPGKQRLLYLDETLAKQGIHGPISVLGTDFLSLYKSAAEISMSGKDISGVTDGIGGFYAGRMYLNVSHTLKRSGKSKLLNTYRRIDRVSAEIIENIDFNEYVPRDLPPRLRGSTWGAVKKSFGMSLGVLRAIKNPDIYHQQYLESTRRYVKELNNLASQAKGVEELARELVSLFVPFFIASLPVLVIHAFAKAVIDGTVKHAPDDIKAKAAYLERALPYNVTTEMGFAMYRLSQMPAIKESASLNEFFEQLDSGLLPQEFMKTWANFMSTYGFRGPKELDVAAPRYDEQLGQFYAQLKAMAQNDAPDSNPEAIFEEAKKQRERDYEAILQWVARRGKRQARKFTNHYKNLTAFGGLRESPKYYFIMATAILRKRVLEVAQGLIEAGRLDSVEQVFDLTIDDLECAANDLVYDLRTKVSVNTTFQKKLESIRDFPRVIDSRGKILRPPIKKPSPNCLVGEPISAGTIRGRVKVLSRPDEKPVLPGEILVARATDPGWTPLFINAAGIVLEVGGMLQHGALVAREYGKPCVSGVERAVATLSDGLLVEVDGSNGIVRIV